jgi:hypothetical protein
MKMAMSDMPSRQEISSLALQLEKGFLSTEAHLEEMTRDEKRLLLENVFMHAYGEDSVGVFVRRQGSRKWSYEIKGTIFLELNGTVTKVKTLGDYNYSV